MSVCMSVSPTSAKELSRGVQKLRLALCNLKLGWISSAWCNAGEQVHLCIASDSCPQICLKGELHHSVPSLQTGHPGATSPITAMTNEVREGTIGNVYLINCSFQLESSLFIIAMNKMHSFWSLATFLLPIIIPKTTVSMSILIHFLRWTFRSIKRLVW